MVSRRGEIPSQLRSQRALNTGPDMPYIPASPDETTDTVFPVLAKSTAFSARSISCPRAIEIISFPWTSSVICSTYEWKPMIESLVRNASRADGVKLPYDPGPSPTRYIKPLVESFITPF